MSTHAPFWRDLVLCVSLSNLLYWRFWRVLLGYHPYRHAAEAPWAALLWVTAGMWAVGLIATVAVRAARRRGGTPQRVVAGLLLLGVLLAANGFRQNEPSLSLGVLRATVGSLPLAALGIGTTALLVSVGRRTSPGRAARMAVVGLLLLSPFALVTTGRSLLRAAAFTRGGPVHLDRAVSPGALMGGRATSRILVVVFDELEYRRAFGDRPRALALPEFDRLVATATAFQNAYPPAGATFVSIPAMLTGQLITKVVRTVEPELLLTLAGTSSEVRWSKQPTVFTRARELGWRSALIGWANPYCQILNADLSYCQAFTMEPLPAARPVENLLQQAVVLAESIPGIYRLQLPRRLGVARPDDMAQWHRSQYDRSVGETLRLLGGGLNDLVFVHLPVPHGPGIHAPPDGLAGESHKDYLGNLLLADQALGAIRRALEETGAWDESVVVVTGDHWARLDDASQVIVFGNPDHRVPFIVKMPGQRKPASRQPRILTTALYPLLVSVMEGRLNSAEDLLRWCDSTDLLAGLPASGGRRLLPSHWE